MNEAVQTKNTLPAVDLGITKQAIGKLRKKFPADNVPDPSTKDGYAEIKSVLREIRPIRTGIEAKRKQLVADAVAWQRRVNSEAKELTAQLQEIEQPYKRAKQQEDERIEAEKKARKEAEERRIAAIESEVEKIQNMTDGLLGADIDMLESRLAQVEAIAITDDKYQEFTDAAKTVRDQVIQQITTALQGARQLEQQRVELEKQQAEIAAKQREMEEERQRMEAAKREQEEKERAEREKQERIEAEKRAAEEAEKRKQALAARLPEDVKLRQYADALKQVEAPDISDEHLCKIRDNAIASIAAIHAMIYQETQETETC